MNQTDSARYIESDSAFSLLLELWEPPTADGQWAASVKLAGCSDPITITDPTQLLTLLMNGDFRPKTNPIADNSPAPICNTSPDVQRTVD